MKKVINVMFWVMAMYLIVTGCIQYWGLISTLFKAEVIELADRGIRAYSGDFMCLMPWKWVAWILLNKIVKLIGLIVVDGIVEGCLTGKKVEVAA